jgi:hypothetical protein
VIKIFAKNPHSRPELLAKSSNTEEKKVFDMTSTGFDLLKMESLDRKKPTQKIHQFLCLAAISGGDTQFSLVGCKKNFTIKNCFFLFLAQLSQKNAFYCTLYSEKFHHHCW